jgi:hypothetical protein
MQSNNPEGPQGAGTANPQTRSQVSKELVAERQ